MRTPTSLLSLLLSSALLLLPGRADAQQPASGQTGTPVQAQPDTAPDAPTAADDVLDAPPQSGNDSGGATEQAASSRVPLDEIRRYVTVFNAVRDGYVDAVDDQQLMRSAIRGLLLDLDPHSAYLERSDSEAFAESTAGAYGGIGVEVMELADGKMRVVAPFDDTPAAKAGLRTGDLIVAVDGRELTSADNEGHGPLRGEPGTSVSLTLVRDGETDPLELTMEREIIRIASVRSELLEPGYGYIRLSAFQVETAQDFERELAALKQQADGGLRGLLIDVRSNPGGLLTSAVRIADDLLETGKIVSTRGRMQVNDAEFNATPGDVLDGAPVVVLMDAGSASAAEVLAAALRDNGRATLVGSRSFGKGSVQTVLPLPNGDAVKLTTARYYTPNGTSIQARGVEPDVVLAPEEGSGPSRTYTEATLPGHLEGDDEDEDTAGVVLQGDGPVKAALAELKRLAEAE